MHSAAAPIEWHDSYLDTRERKIITCRQCPIPGLQMFGYCNTSHALPPLPPHYHKNCFEFTYIVRGNLRFSVAGEDYDLSGGDMYITFPNEVHHTGNTPMSLHTMYWFQLDFSNPEYLLYLTPASARTLAENLYRLPSRVIRMKESAGMLLPRIFSDMGTDTEISRLQSAQLMSFLLFQILRDADVSDACTTADIEAAARYIREHLRENLTLEDLAARSLLSVSRFKQKFKDQTGTSPRNYINFRKIELAKQLLRQGASVTDTAMELNFSSSSYFSSVFRRYTSQSPSEYAAEIQK